MADDLARRIRDYAAGPGRAAVATSSAWLAREFGVDPRTIAAALRPFGVRPAEVEPGVRGYVIADLAGIVLEDQAAEPVVDVSAVDRLSEALGHPAGPVLRAAGLL